MKELSIEEKAQRYDEVIERAKKWYNAPNVDKIPTFGNRIIEEIFPELKESGNIRIIKAIKYGLDHVFTNNTTVFEVTKEQCLTWLEKQGQQKPAEWSEEDEKAINDIMWIIEAYRKNGFNETHMQIADSSETWLKSIRPQKQWKPSKEQMNALDSTLQYSQVSHNSFEYLNSLYNDLKKLREE